MGRLKFTAFAPPCPTDFYGKAVPGGAVCIVPVHSQHCGRLFLPFVDDDPKTAETLSKVILPARDSEIQDPTILEQMLRR